MSFHCLQVIACKASSCFYFENDNTGYFRSSFSNFDSTAVNQGYTAYRLMFPQCKMVVTISITEMFLMFFIETQRKIENVLFSMHFYKYVQINILFCIVSKLWNCVSLQMV